MVYCLSQATGGTKTINTIFDLRIEDSQELVEKVSRLFDDEVIVKSMKDADMKACIGCWNCWIKTPGVCALKDDLSAIYSDYINSSKVILLVDTAQGFIDHRTKCFLDRMIPHYHPYITVRNGEFHHIKRYDSYPDMYIHFDSTDLTPIEELLIEDYISRTVFHFRGQAYRIYDQGEGSTRRLELNHAKRHMVDVESVPAMNKLVIYNGSPRLSGSNSKLILDQIKKALPEQVEVRDLKEIHKWDQWSESFSHDDNVMFFMPLYVHAMPSHVMDFIERLSPSSGSISFVVQSGFPESSQSHYLESYFEQLSVRLNRTYLGTAIKGGVEGLQVRPLKAQEQIIKPFVELVQYTITAGRFDETLVKQMASPVRLSKIMQYFISLMPTKLLNFYWNMLLKKNKAFEKRFDQPYKAS